MGTLIDTNCLIDVEMHEDDEQNWSWLQIQREIARGPVTTNAVVLSEIAAGPNGLYRVGLLVYKLNLTWADMSREAAELAGQAHRRYREAGGRRARTLPDFLIGAHALVEGWSLLTRDRRAYAAYFPSLQLITPETHPS